MSGVPTDKRKNWNVFLSSLFFVLGFSIIFSLVGILLQTFLKHATYEATLWFDRIGGILIIFFGLFSLGLVQPTFLKVDHTIAVKKKFKSYFLTSFIFGAAFAVGWTPCVSAALGAILALAATQAGSAFFLLVSYTLGIGVPFLIVGLFADRAQAFIARSGSWLRCVEYIFGALLVVLGILIFTGELSKIANVQFLTTAVSLLHINTDAGSGISSLSLINAGFAFLAGLASFLSPCVLPIIPGFLSFLATSAAKPIVK